MTILYDLMFTIQLIACVVHLRSKKTDLSPFHCSFFYHYVQLQLQVEVRRFGSVWGLRPIRPFPQTFKLVFLPRIPQPPHWRARRSVPPHICVYIFSTAAPTLGGVIPQLRSSATKFRFSKVHDSTSNFRDIKFINSIYNTLRRTMSVRLSKA